MKAHRTLEAEQIDGTIASALERAATGGVGWCV
jgi:hypothetical protein